MATITLRIPDDELSVIDSESGGNRTQFMLNATREAIARLRRARLDLEVSRILLEDVERDMEIDREFVPAIADGLE